MYSSFITGSRRSTIATSSINLCRCAAPGRRVARIHDPTVARAAPVTRAMSAGSMPRERTRLISFAYVATAFICSESVAKMSARGATTRHLPQPALEVPTVYFVGREHARTLESHGRIVVAAQAMEQLSARGMEEVVPVELAALGEALHDVKRPRRPGSHGNGDRAVQLHDRAGHNHEQQVVQADDARPIGFVRGSCA